MGLLTLWTEWSGAIETIGGLVGGYAANVARVRLQTQANALSNARIEADRSELALEREKSLTDRVLRQSVTNAALVRGIYAREAILLQYHASVIGARLTIHELQSRIGMPLTKFEPLPGYPPAELVDQNSLLASDDPTTAVDQAASTADPGGCTPTGKPAPPTAAAAEPVMANKNERNAKGN